MNIVQEQTGSLEAAIKIELSKDDYQERVSKELKSMQRKAQIPGFRPGKVPFGMIQKMYGKSVLVEEVNKVLTDALYEYIKENKLNILGSPVADRQQASSIDWDDLDGFPFTYQIGLAPEIDLDLSPEIEMPYHVISVDDDMLAGYITDIRRRYGKMTNPGISEAGDVLLGQFEEMESPEQPKQGGVSHKSNLYIEYIKDEGIKNQLIGIKPGESLVIDIIKAVESESEASAMVGVKKEELSSISPLFRFSLESVSRVEPAAMGPELYDKVAPGKGIETEEAFNELVREQIGQQYQADVDKHFRNEVKEKLLETTSLELPEAFLKTWLLDTNQEEVTLEQVEQEFDKLADSFRWQLIENHLVRKYELDVTKQDIHDHLSAYFHAQMRQYGQEDIDQDVIEGFIQNIYSKEDEIKKVAEHLIEQKLLALYKANLSLQRVELTFNEFVKLVTDKYKPEEKTEEQIESGNEPS